jgi:hypothetical protein
MFTVIISLPISRQVCEDYEGRYMKAIDHMKAALLSSLILLSPFVLAPRTHVVSRMCPHVPGSLLVVCVEDMPWLGVRTSRTT